MRCEMFLNLEEIFVEDEIYKNKKTLLKKRVFCGP
jgi:hypothetical protein